MKPIDFNQKCLKCGSTRLEYIGHTYNYFTEGKPHYIDQVYHCVDCNTTFSALTDAENAAAERELDSHWT